MIDSERLFLYVERSFGRADQTEWPTIRKAARALGWTQSRVAQAVEDHEHLGTQSYYCTPPEPLAEHEIYSTAE